MEVPPWYAPPVPVRQDDGMDLVEFLKARLDDDEVKAKAAGGSWRYERLADGPAGEPGGYSLELSDENVIVDVGFFEDDVMRPADAEHIARHDPARVLADVEAKRRTIRAHDKWCQDECEATYPNVGPDAAYYWQMKLHAAIYADHPDYRDEWRP